MANFNLADYETVDSRIKRFYSDHPSGRIITDLVDKEGAPGSTRWTVKASVWRGDGDGLPDGTGLAFEIDGTGMANKTSALENCETSAIGRALANIGYSGDKRASREEMAKTQQQVKPPEGWRGKVAACQSLKDLQSLYESEAIRWYTPDVKAAFSARKAEIQNV